MPASLRRKALRETLHGKYRVFRWEGDVTVRVMWSSSYGTRSSPKKFDSRAERSSPRREKGDRGLRKNKSRLRGRHPRVSACRQPSPSPQRPATDDRTRTSALPKGVSGAFNRLEPGRAPSSRAIRSVLRHRDYISGVAESFGTRLRYLNERGLFTPPSRVSSNKSLGAAAFHGGVGWTKTRRRWECLHSHFVRKFGQASADLCFSHKFNAFIEDVVRIRVEKTPFSGPTNSSSMFDLLNMLGNSDLPRREKDHGVTSVSSARCTGAFCRVCGRRSAAGAPCPGLKRAPATKVQEGGRRNPRPKRGN